MGNTWNLIDLADVRDVARSSADRERESKREKPHNEKHRDRLSDRELKERERERSRERVRERERQDERRRIENIKKAEASVAKDGVGQSREEHRIDPDDGDKCTYTQIYEKYKDKYSSRQIQDYWDYECRR